MNITNILMENITDIRDMEYARVIPVSYELIVIFYYIMICGLLLFFIYIFSTTLKKYMKQKVKRK